MLSTKVLLVNPGMVIESVGPIFTFYQKKKHMIEILFWLRLTDLGSFSVKDIYIFNDHTPLLISDSDFICLQSCIYWVLPPICRWVKV